MINEYKDVIIEYSPRMICIIHTVIIFRNQQLYLFAEIIQFAISSYSHSASICSLVLGYSFIQVLIDRCFNLQLAAHSFQLWRAVDFN